MASSLPRSESVRRAFSFDLLREPWIPCEYEDGSVAYFGVHDVLLGAHKIAGVHDSSPLVTAMLHRLLLAVLYRAFGPITQKDWLEIWETPRLDPTTLRGYFETVADRFDLFHPERPFLQVARLYEQLEAKPEDVSTPAWRLALDHSQYSAASHLFARLPEDASVSPGEAARSLLAYLGFCAGGRIQNESVSRKAGILRAGAVVLIQGKTLRETLLLNLTWHKPKAGDVPPWERKSTERATRAPNGHVDMMVWPSRRVLLIPELDANGKTLVKHVITAAGEDLDAAVIDPMFAYFKRKEEPDLVAVKMTPSRATWRDAALILDAGGLSAPLAVCQLADPAMIQAVSGRGPLRLELLGLIGGGPGRASAIADWRSDTMPLPLSLLSKERIETLRTALTEAENLASALRTRVLYALTVTLVVAPDKGTVDGIRENLGTLPAYWRALGARFNGWLEQLGAPAEAPATLESHLVDVLQTWRGYLREIATEVVLQAVNDIGLAGRAIRAGTTAERVLESVLAELVPLPEGETAESMTAPRHEPPVWADTTKFIPALDKLVESKDLGALAALRQSLQVPNRIASEARPIVEPLLPADASRHARRSYYLVAALRAVHRESSAGVSLGAAMRRIHDPAEEHTSTSERFEQILAAHRDNVGELVSAVLPLVYEHGAVDWELLLHDLLFWGWRDRIIQRAWARDFYEGPGSAGSPPASTAAADPSPSTPEVS
jgi:CRISPR system Cascade subunit CasA